MGPLFGPGLEGVSQTLLGQLGLFAFLGAGDLIVAKLFLRLALSGANGIRPRVINVDGHVAYARAIGGVGGSLSTGGRMKVVVAV